MSRTFAVLILLALAVSCGEAPQTKQAAQPPAIAAENATPQPRKQNAKATETAELPPAERAKRLAVGEAAPNFRLQDQQGKERTLDDLITDGNVALVFYRSADW